MKYSIPQLFWDGGQWLIFTIAHDRGNNRLMVTKGKPAEDDFESINWSTSHYFIGDREWLVFDADFADRNVDDKSTWFLRIRWHLGELYFEEPFNDSAPYKFDYQGKMSDVSADDFYYEKTDDTHSEDSRRNSVPEDVFPALSKQECDIAKTSWSIQRMIPPWPRLVSTRLPETEDAKFLSVWEMLYQFKQQAKSQDDYVHGLKYLLNPQILYANELPPALMSLHDWLFKSAKKTDAFTYTILAIEKEIQRGEGGGQSSLAKLLMIDNINDAYIPTYSLEDRSQIFLLFRKAFIERAIQQMNKAECRLLRAVINELRESTLRHENIFQQSQQYRQLLLLVQCSGIDSTKYFLDRMHTEIVMREELIEKKKVDDHAQCQQRLSHLVSDIQELDDKVLQFMPPAVISYWVGLLFTSDALASNLSYSITSIAERLCDERIFNNLLPAAQVLIVENLASKTITNRNVQRIVDTKLFYSFMDPTEQERAVLVYWSGLAYAGENDKLFKLPGCKSVAASIKFCQNSWLLSHLIVADDELRRKFIDVRKSTFVCKKLGSPSDDNPILELAARHPSIAAAIAAENVAVEEKDRDYKLESLYQLIMSSDEQTSAAVNLIKTEKVKLFELHEISQRITKLAVHPVHGVAVVETLFANQKNFTYIDDKQLEYIVLNYLDLLRDVAPHTATSGNYLHAINSVIYSEACWNRLSLLIKTRICLEFIYRSPKTLEQAGLLHVMEFMRKSPMANFTKETAKAHIDLFHEMGSKPRARSLRKSIRPEYVKLTAWLNFKDKGINGYYEENMDFSEYDMEDREKKHVGYKNLLDILVARSSEVALILIDKELLQQSGYPVEQLIIRAGQFAEPNVALALYESKLIPRDFEKINRAAPRFFKALIKSNMNWGALLASQKIEVADLMITDKAKGGHPFLTKKNIGYVFAKLLFIYGMKDPRFQEFFVKLLERNQQYHCERIENFALYKNQLIAQIVENKDDGLCQRLLSTSALMKWHLGYGSVSKLIGLAGVNVDCAAPAAVTETGTGRPIRAF